MAIFRVSHDALIPLAETRFSAEGIMERHDLQRLLRTHIQALDPDLMVISEEFSQWTDSGRRIDLLCIDKGANLVVIELKRSDDGGFMELQAIRYAAMISVLTFSQLVDAHSAFLRSTDDETASAQDSILSFLGWEQPLDDEFAKEVRIVLAAADFSKELTTSVLWLNNQGLDIRCVRLKPYRDGGGEVFVDVQQLIPLPEASDCQTQIKAKEQAGRVERIERHELRHRFWDALLKHARKRTDLHAGRSPTIYNWIGGSIGRRGFQLNYAVREEESQVELFIDLGTGSEAANLSYFRELQGQRGEIEASFGTDLEWQDLPGKRACRVRSVVQGGYRSPDSEWPEIHAALVSKMIRLEESFQPFVQRLPSEVPGRALDALADEAIADHRAGRTQPL